MLDGGDVSAKLCHGVSVFGFWLKILRERSTEVRHADCHLSCRQENSMFHTKVKDFMNIRKCTHQSHQANHAMR